MVNDEGGPYCVYSKETNLELLKVDQLGADPSERCIRYSSHFVWSTFSYTSIHLVIGLRGIEGGLFFSEKELIQFFWRINLEMINKQEKYKMRNKFFSRRSNKPFLVFYHISHTWTWVIDAEFDSC